MSEIVDFNLRIILLSPPEGGVKNKNLMWIQQKILLHQIRVFQNYTAYNKRNAIISENNPSASVKANPKIAYENKSDLIEGFLDVPLIKAAKTIPTPIPAPANPIVVSPAPIIFALTIMIYYFGTFLFR